MLIFSGLVFMVPLYRTYFRKSRVLGDGRSSGRSRLSRRDNFEALDTYGRSCRSLEIKWMSSPIPIFPEEHRPIIGEIFLFCSKCGVIYFL